MKDARRSRGRGGGQVNISRLLYYTNAMVAVGASNVVADSMRPCFLPWQMRNVSKQKALHTFRQQAKYKLNFLLKDKGKFRRAARVRESGRKGKSERE